MSEEIARVGPERSEAWPKTEEYGDEGEGREGGE